MAHCITALSQYAKVARSIPGQGTCKNQPMNASTSGTKGWCFFVSLPLLPSPPSKINIFFKLTKIKQYRKRPLSYRPSPRLVHFSRAEPAHYTKIRPHCSLTQVLGPPTRSPLAHGLNYHHSAALVPTFSSSPGFLH